MRHIWGRNELPAGFWWENLKRRSNLQNLGADESAVHQRTGTEVVELIRLGQDREIGGFC